MPQDPVPDPSAPDPGPDASRGLLQQMEEMMAALNADLSQLDADLQSSAERPPAADGPGSDGPGADSPMADGHPGPDGSVETAAGSDETHSASGSANSRSL